MKKLLLSIAFLCLFISPINAEEDTKVLDVQQEVEEENIFFPEIVVDSSVSIIHGGISMGTCSGVLIDENEDYSFVLSAKHCTHPTDLEVRVENNKVNLIVASVDDDLVYLIVRGRIPNKTPVKFAKYEAYIGEKIYHVGYPNWLEYRTEGVVAKKLNDYHFAIMSVMSGCSGGGIFNKDGELVGILWGSMRLGPGGLFSKGVKASIYEPLSDVKKFLKKVGHEI